MSRFAPSRPHSEDGSWAVVGQPLGHARREQVHAVLARAAELLDRPPPVAADLAGADRAQAALTRTWQDAADALAAAVHQGTPHQNPANQGTVHPDTPHPDTPHPVIHDPARLMALVELVREVKEAEDGVRDDRSALRAGTGDVVREALHGLRDVRSIAELTERAPGAAAAIGFDRVLLSRIEESSWVPETMYVADDARWAEEILQAGRDDLRTLDSSLLETQIVRRNRPLVVGDTDRPDLHRALIDVTRTRSYAAAPVVGWGRVIGFLHADCYRQRRQLDRTDSDLLWMFCDGLGHLVVRTAATDTLRALRTELGRLLSGSTPGSVFGPGPAGDQGWPRPAVGLPAAGAAAAPPAPPLGRVHGVEGALTRREVEVMRLMGAGHTNAQIARRLVISEGTVKSHVKHILRKLDAANRAEAVSRWLREEHARSAGQVRRIGA